MHRRRNARADFWVERTYAREAQQASRAFCNCLRASIRIPRITLKQIHIVERLLFGFVAKIELAFQLYYYKQPKGGSYNMGRLGVHLLQLHRRGPYRITNGGRIEHSVFVELSINKSGTPNMNSTS